MGYSDNIVPRRQRPGSEKHILKNIIDNNTGGREHIYFSAFDKTSEDIGVKHTWRIQ
jgi:hypothetical protein